MGRFISLLGFLGINLVLLKKNIGGLFFYFRDLSLLKKQKGDDVSFVFGKKYPILSERFLDGGTMSGHYFHQDLFVAKEIFKEGPIKHVDVGSRTDGFIAHLAVFRKVEVLDIRQLDSKVDNISFRKADLMKPAEGMINYCDSISSLHAIEHFGLGRYGDPIDYFGHLKAIKNITSILKKGGVFYFSVPIGKQRIEFNAHRVFSVKYLLGLFEENYGLVSFSYVNDAGDFFENVELSDGDVSTNFGCKYGCGIFKLLKN
jgi:SAM-dependent methyltransferase